MLAFSQMDSNAWNGRNTEIDFQLTTSVLSDKTDMLQLGSTETEFNGPYTTDFKEKKITYWNQYQNSQFSVRLHLDPHLQIVNRKIDGVLDWLATCGGLLFALHLVAELLIEVYAVYFIKSKLAWLLVKVLPSDKPEDENQENQDKEGKEGGEKES